MEQSEKEFERLVRDNEQAIYSICYLYSHNEEDARDLMQDVLVNLWNGIPKFRGDSSVRTWITRIAINTCISHKRKKKIDTVSEDYIPQVSDTTPETGRQIQFLHNRLRKLNYLDRAIVLLWLEDMAYDEIGAIVGMDAKNIGVRLVRIKNKLKNIQEDEK
jgi:RNA polymerase sigma-70 factor (ECF subfamily)